MNRLLRLERLEKALLRPTKPESEQLLASLSDDQLEALEAAWADGPEAAERCLTSLLRGAEQP